MANSRFSWLFASACGAFAALGHAPFGLWPAALLGFAGLIWLVSDSARPGRTAWLGGAGYFAVALHWIVEPFLVDIQTHGWMAPFALILLAGGLALFWGLAGWGASRLASTPHRLAFAFVVLLALAELVRGHIFTGFPWALPAYVWADTPLRTVAAHTGSYGLSFLTLLGVALPVIARKVWLGAIGSLLMFATLMMVGFGQYMLFHTNPKALGTVRIVQPNVPQSEKWDRDLIPGHFERMLNLTRSPAETPVDLVVWPEVAVVYPLDRADASLAAGMDAVTWGTTPTTRLVTGINRRDAENNWYNALAVVGPDTTIEETYDKVHLVPFGEYIPFKIDVIRAMAATSGFGFTPGARVRAIDTPLGRALPLICYEGIFPGHIFKAGERPDYLLQLTNDAWFGTFSGPYQHLDQARFRAVEQGLSLVRAANTGVSTVINPLGDMPTTLGLNQPGILDLTVPAPRQPTLYARTGDLPLIVILLITLGALFLAKRRNAIANGRTTS